MSSIVRSAASATSYTISGLPPWEVGTATGTLHFRRGESVRVEGLILRTERGIVVLSLNPPLPFAQMMAEQRYLRSKGFLINRE